MDWLVVDIGLEVATGVEVEVVRTIDVTNEVGRSDDDDIVIGCSVETLADIRDEARRTRKM